ncbi:hypothetical protein HYT56_05135 [Candidatus Woesearchaeota archaeon]|nr:hypothetical protein [Candidatus Woesearchaeota archaeon]
MRKLINKIIIHLDKEKVKHWVKSKVKSKAKEDYYVCKVCKHVYLEEAMNPNDVSICNDCSRH